MYSDDKTLNGFTRLYLINWLLDPLYYDTADKFKTMLPKIYQTIIGKPIPKSIIEDLDLDLQKPSYGKSYDLF